MILAGLQGVGAVSNLVQSKSKDGKVGLSGQTLKTYTSVQERLSKLLRNKKSPCAKFLISRGFDPDQVADALSAQSAYNAKLSTNPGPGLHGDYAVKELFKMYDWDALRGDGGDVYYRPNKVNTQVVLHETLHQAAGGISDAALATKLGLPPDALAKAGSSRPINDELRKNGCK